MQSTTAKVQMTLNRHDMARRFDVRIHPGVEKDEIALAVEIFNLFLNHNPDITTRTKKSSFQHVFVDFGDYLWRPWCWKSMDFLDPHKSLRLKGIRKSWFDVSHPYRSPETPELLLEGLRYVEYSRGDSWHFPQESLLSFIARPEVFELLRLDYLGEPNLVINGESKL